MMAIGMLFPQIVDTNGWSGLILMRLTLQNG
jgi:hypothetical protein